MKKPLPFLFPKEDIRVVQLADRMIFHRGKTSTIARGLLGTASEICVQGFAVYTETADKKKNTQLGTFIFRGKDQLGGKVTLRDEGSVRYVMAGIILGERSTRYHLKKGNLHITQGRIADLEIANQIWQKWNWEWSEPRFREECKMKNVLPLHHAVDSLASIGIKLSPEALKKQLQSLKLPL